MRRYAILDRDDTIIDDPGYLNDPDKLVLLPFAAEGMRKMIDLDIGLIIISNQSGIARGLTTPQQADNVRDRLLETLKEKGVNIDGYFYCPHHPDDKCKCRKPETGLIKEAAKKLHFNPEECFVIGDKKSDIDLGKNVKAKTILIIGKENTPCEPDFKCSNLLEAANFIKENL